MERFLESQLGHPSRRRGQSPARTAANGSALPAGYRLSSHDLSTGLEIRTVSINTLPPDVVAELVRMRRLWEGAELPVRPTEA
jgi:hypothetical protein